jgi:hypothetical protein
VDLKDREVPIKCNEIFDFVKGQLKNLDLAPPQEILELKSEELSPAGLDDSTNEKLEQSKIRTLKWLHNVTLIFFSVISEPKTMAVVDELLKGMPATEKNYTEAPDSTQLRLAEETKLRVSEAEAYIAVCRKPCFSGKNVVGS